VSISKMFIPVYTFQLANAHTILTSYMTTKNKQTTKLENIIRYDRSSQTIAYNRKEYPGSLKGTCGNPYFQLLGLLVLFKDKI